MLKCLCVSNQQPKEPPGLSFLPLPYQILLELLPSWPYGKLHSYGSPVLSFPSLWPNHCWQISVCCSVFFCWIIFLLCLCCLLFAITSLSNLSLLCRRRLVRPAILPAACFLRLLRLGRANRFFWEFFNLYLSLSSCKLPQPAPFNLWSNSLSFLC